MTVFMPPIQRKKKVFEKYNPDTFRVISEQAETNHPKFLSRQYTASFEPKTPPAQITTNPLYVNPVLKNTRVLPQILPDYRQHKPQTKFCHFINENVKFYNEPICTVSTAGIGENRDKWWPARENPGTLAVPPYAEETRYRMDYNYRYGERPNGSGRHAANVNREPARGAVPVNTLREKDGSQRFYKEGMSYEHIYNCRDEKNYPIRGKRQGAFVWSQLDPLSQKKFIEYYQNLERQEQMNAGPSLAAGGAQGPLVVRSACNNSAAPSKRNSASSISRSDNCGKSVSAASATDLCVCSDTTQVLPQSQADVKQETSLNVGGCGEPADASGSPHN